MQLEQQLRAAGATVTEIGLRGRFHYQGYQDELEKLLAFCDSNSQVKFPDAKNLSLPMWSEPKPNASTKGGLHRVALQAILLERSEWYQTFANVQSSRLSNKNDRVISFGPERCVPPSILRRLNSRIIHFEDVHEPETSVHSKAFCTPSSQYYNESFSPDDIAVIGMSCNLPGADDLEGFWRILVDGKSQHKEVPPDRFGFETVFREAESKGKWYGNFINNHDAFDHNLQKDAARGCIDGSTAKTSDASGLPNSGAVWLLPTVKMGCRKAHRVLHWPMRYRL